MLAQNVFDMYNPNWNGLINCNKKMCIRDRFQDGSVGILDLLVSAGLAPSKAEGRRLVQQGGISVNEEKVMDPTARIPADLFAKGDVIVKKGKKVFHKVTK